MIWKGIRIDVQLDGGDDGDEDWSMREGIKDDWNGTNVSKVGKGRVLKLGDEVIEAEDEGSRGFPVVDGSDAVDGL